MLQIDHGDDGVEQEADKMRNRNMRNAIGWDCVTHALPGDKGTQIAYLSTRSGGPFSSHNYNDQSGTASDF